MAIIQARGVGRGKKVGREETGELNPFQILN